MGADLLVGTCAVVTGGTGVLSNPIAGSKVFTRSGFQISINASGVTVSKASSFGGTQLALAFPLSRADARGMAEAIMELAG